MITRRIMQRKTAATERRVAAELGGRRVFASGSGYEKGDVRVDPPTRDAAGNALEGGDPLVVESKRVFVGNSYTLSSQTWAKVCSIRMGAEPVMHVQTTTGELAVVCYRWCLGLKDPIVLSYRRTGVKSVTLRPNMRPGFSGIYARYSMHYMGRDYDICVLSWKLFKDLYEARRIAE